MFFSFLSNPHIAIIGDIKNSKKIENRNQIQIGLKKVLEDLNEVYQADISSKFTITLGDEFQGLLCKGTNVMNIIGEIERKMYPVKIRFGIGIGEITTGIISEMAIGADGPGYYMARNAIVYLKEEEKKNQTEAADTRIEVDGGYEEITIMLNTILSLMTVIKESWSSRQQEIIWNLLEYQDSQSNVANRLCITQPAVHKALAKGNYYAYKSALDTVAKVLKEIRRDHV